MIHIIDERKLAQEKVDYATKLLKKFEKRGAVFGDENKDLKRIKSMMSKGRFQKATQDAKKLTSQIKARYAQYQRIKEDLPKVRGLTKTDDKELSSRAHKVFSNAETLYEGGSYAESSAMLTSFLQGLDKKDIKVKKKVEKKAKSEKDETITYIQAVILKTLEAQKKGLPISESEKLLKKANEAVNSNFYSQARSYADDALEKVESAQEEFRAYLDEVTEVIKNVNHLKGSGINTGVIEKLVFKAKEKLDEVKYAEVDELIERIYEKIEVNKQTYKKALSAIEAANELIKDTKGAGANTMIPEKSLKEARKAVEQGDYPKALKMADESHEETVKIIQRTLDKLHKEEVDYQAITNIIVEAEAVIDECEEYTKIPEAREMLDRAKKYLEKKEFIEESRRLATDAKALAKETKNQYIETMEGIQEANKRIKVLRASGVSTSKVEAKLEKVLNAIDKNDFLEALTLSKNLLDHLNDLESTYESALENIKASEALLKEEARILKDDETKKFTRLLSEAKEALEEKKYKIANQKSMEVVKFLEDLYNESSEDIDRSKKVMDEIDAVIEVFERDGMLMEEPLTTYEEARESLKRREYEEAWQKCQEVQTSIAEIKEDFDSAKALLSAGDILVRNMKEQGMDVVHMEELLEQSREAFKVGDYATARQTANQIEQEGLPGMALAQKIEKVNKRVQETRLIMSSVRDEGSEISKIESRLMVEPIFKDYYRRLLYNVMDKAKADLEQAANERDANNLDRAMDLADAAKSSVEEMIRKYSKALSSLHRANQILPRLTGEAHEKAELHYKQAKSALELADYDKTANYANMVVEVANKLQPEAALQRPGQPGLQQAVPAPVAQAQPVQQGQYPQPPATPPPVQPMQTRPLGAQQAPAQQPPVQQAAPAITRPLPQDGQVQPAVVKARPVVAKAKVKKVKGKVGPDDVRKYIELAEQTVEKMDGAGVDITQGIELLEQAKVEFEAENYKLALRTAKKARVVVVQAAEDTLATAKSKVKGSRAKELIEEAEELLRSAPAKANALEILLSKARESMANEKYSHAETFAQEVIKKAQGIREDFMEAKFLLEQVEMASKKTKKDLSLIISNGHRELKEGNYRYVKRLCDRAFSLMEMSPPEFSADEEEDEVDVDVSDVPANVMAVLQKELPGAVVEAAELETEDGVRQYELKVVHDGKRYEVEITPDGRVIEVEAEDDEEEEEGPSEASAAPAEHVLTSKPTGSHILHHPSETPPPTVDEPPVKKAPARTKTPEPPARPMTPKQPAPAPAAKVSTPEEKADERKAELDETIDRTKWMQDHQKLKDELTKLKNSILTRSI